MTDYNLQQRVYILQVYACHPKTDGAAFSVKGHVCFRTGPLPVIQHRFWEDLYKHKSCLEKDETAVEGHPVFRNMHPLYFKNICL
jgi:hypothetical protein